jgi:hypothetical protein
MISPDRFIASCNSWDDFWDSAKSLSASEKGIAFERLTPGKINMTTGGVGSWRTVMSHFKRKFGKVFDMIRPLPDFGLFRLIPDDGLYVRGFGQAFEISPENIGIL